MSSNPPDDQPPEQADPKGPPVTQTEDKEEAAALEAELLSLVPEEKRNEARAVLHRISMHYAGPIPMAAEMQRLAQVDPTFPERIMRIYEKQVDHRHNLEEKALDRDYWLKSRGQHYALISVIILGIIAVILAFMHATTAAGVIAGTAIVGVVGVFVTGRLLQAKDTPEAAED